MGEYQFVKVAVEDRTGIITIDHPPANAFNTQTMLDLNDAFDEMTANPQVKVIIITGAGTFFIAGADINEIAAIQGPEDGYVVVRKGQEVFDKIELSKKPVIAAINGSYCLGGGMELAMACHLRLAEDSIQMGQPEITLGVVPGWGGMQRLPRLVGTGNALELMLGGGRIKAQEAYRIGLVNKVVPAGTVVREAKRWAKLLSMWSALCLGAILKAVYQGQNMDLYAAIEQDARIFAGLTATGDMREGVNAFLQKRRPAFKDA